MKETTLRENGAAERGSKRIKSVEIGYRVLLAVQRGPGAVKLSEIAKRCGLSTGAAHNYLASLVSTGLVEQEVRGLYRLGPSAFALSLASFRQLNGYDIMRDAAQSLHQLTAQSTAVTVWSQGGPVSVYIQRSEDPEAFEFRSGHLPMLNSGAGMLFMALLPEQLTRELIEAELAVGNHGDATADSLIEAARKSVLALGYAQYFYKKEAPLALSIPVWTEDCRIPFTLSIVVHRRVKATVVENWVQALKQSAYQASLLLGRLGVDGPKSDIVINPQDSYA